MNCGEPIVGRNANAKYCSDECQRRAWQQRNPGYFSAWRLKNPDKPYYYQPKAVVGERDCLICSRPFLPYRADHRICSRACHNENSKAKQKAARDAARDLKDDVCCAVCGTAFRPWKLSIVCSQACRKLYQRTSKGSRGGHRYRLRVSYWKPTKKPKVRIGPRVVRGGPHSRLYGSNTLKNYKRPNPRVPRLFIAGTCRNCGDPFVSREPNQRDCSPGCNKAIHRRELRHSRKKAVKVFEADRFVCWLCGDPCDRDAKVPNYWAATVDHVIPRSKGGSDEYENLRCAHFICNSRRGSADVPSNPPPFV